MTKQASATWSDPGDLTRELFDWFRQHQRTLPWRTKPSLYGTVVSEFMLQQTQVVTVLPYYQRWLEVFPDFHALAAAPESLVMKHWEGLGYYRRARNLHRLAQVWVEEDPKPQTAADWLVFPGVGPYTAAAIASIAQNDRSAVVDGNVVRILTRLQADNTLYRDSGSAVKALAPLAQSLMDVAKHPGDHNQAMMELGATVCHKNRPNCLLCPVKRHCLGCQQSIAETLPRFQPRLTHRRKVSRLWCCRDGRLLLHRIPAKSRRLAGLWELPESTPLTPESAGLPLLARKKRGISNELIEETVYKLTNPAPSFLTVVDANPHLTWVPLNELNHLTLTGPHRKWIHELLKRES